MANFTGSISGVLKYLSIITDTMMAQRMRPDRSLRLDNAIKNVGEYLGTDQSETIIFALILGAYLCDEERPVSLWRVGGWMGVDQFLIAQFSDDIESLVDKGLIVEDNEIRKGVNNEFNKCSFYSVKKSVMNAIIHNQPLGAYIDRKSINSDTNLILPEKIKYKELFYMPDIAPEINRIKEALLPENFRRIQAQMLEKKTSCGMCIMFYGAPGTGKTESVLQLAKACNRAVFQVETGSVISKWIGETENNIYKTFRDYEKQCDEARKYNRLEPILFFNEADGIFGKRINNATRGELTENKVQAIMLDQMERLDGILMATTNVEANFDAAYERRFLFKVKFAKPDTDIKKKIWTNKLDWLGDSAAETLARKYDFSGGEIDNIVRKVAMDEVLKGERTSLEDLEEYCRNEKFSSRDNGRHIGF
ncbi:MAG: ATP-binding protein [Spirochaetales bacterium]|nr:ATP-binding protein [Spirochaetales bacterium]MBR6200604.1 ATP-binding protein [Spirochaetales bacterium]